MSILYKTFCPFLNNFNLQKRLCTKKRINHPQIMPSQILDIVHMFMYVLAIRIGPADLTTAHCHYATVRSLILHHPKKKFPPWNTEKNAIKISRKTFLMPPPFSDLLFGHSSLWPPWSREVFFCTITPRNSCTAPCKRLWGRL